MGLALATALTVWTRGLTAEACAMVALRAASAIFDMMICTRYCTVRV
jgi:hypothetical protein